MCCSRQSGASARSEIVFSADCDILPIRPIDRNRCQREIDLLNARHNIDEAKISLETTAKNVESDVKTTWLQVETLQETIESLKAQVAANEQNYKDLLNQYQAGTATSLDTQTGLIQLVTSKTSLITQTFEYQVALRDLQRSVAAFQNDRVKKCQIPISLR